jgi:hypothetical protein
MSKWIIVIGYILLVLGLAMLTPLRDLLPFDFWHKLKSLFSTEGAPYYKVVSTTQSYAPTIVAVGLGLILVLLGMKASSALRGQ